MNDEVEVSPADAMGRFRIAFVEFVGPNLDYTIELEDNWIVVRSPNLGVAYQHLKKELLQDPEETRHSDDSFLITGSFQGYIDVRIEIGEQPAE